MNKKLLPAACIMAISCFALSFVQPAHGATKKALLIGINDYKNLPYYSKELGRQITNLKGSVNDVNAMKEILEGQYGFKKQDVKVLINSEATRANILKTFESWLISGTRPGDTVFFYFSGHGTQVPDQNGDEEDGLDEALCAWDVLTIGARSVAEAGIIIDDEIGILLRKLEKRNVIGFVDACHSGTVTRSLRGEPVSTLELTPAYRPKFIPVQIEGTQVRSRGSSLNTAPKQDDIPPGQIFMFSSMENQISVELTMPFRSNGAFTLGLVDGLKAKRSSTYKGLHEHVLDFVKNRHKLEQTPVLEPKEGPVVAGLVFEPLATAAPVQPPAPSKPSPQKPPSTPDAAQARPPKPQEPVTPAKPSTPQAAAPAAPQPPPEVKGEKVLVRIDTLAGATPGVTEQIRKSLAALDYVKLTKDDFFDRIIRGEIRAGSYQVRLVNRIGDTIRIPPAASIDAVVKQICSRLQDDYIVKQFARIHNPDPPFKVNVWVTEQGRNDFKLGEKVEFNFHSEQDCYVMMFNKDAEGNITMLFPNQYHKETFVKGGQTIKIPDDKMQFDLKFFEPTGEEMVKVIATKEPLKLSDIGIEDIKPYLSKDGLVVLHSPGESITRSIKPVARIQENLSSRVFTWSDAMVVIRSHPNK